MSGHTPWRDINHNRPYKHVLAQESKQAMIAWVAGYMTGLEDVLADLRQAQRDGAETLEAAIEEVQVSRAAAVWIQKTLETGEEP